MEEKDLSDLAFVKQLGISYESSVRGGAGTYDFIDAPPTEKTYTLQSSSKGSLIENKDEVINVNINIDGKIQTIELKDGD